VFGENLVAQSTRTVTSLLMGRVLGAAAVGTYTLAANVILVPFSRISAPLQQVFFPAFSRLNDDRTRLADLWIRASRVVGLISIPSLVGLAIVAPDFVQVALGPKWSGTTAVIQLLAVVGIVASLQTLSAEVLLALGRAGALFALTVLSVTLGLAAFIVGLHWGVVGAATAALVVSLLIEPLRTLMTTRALEIPFRRFLGALSGIAQATAVMAICVVAARQLLLAMHVPPAARLTTLAALGVIVYIGCSLWRVPEVAQEFEAVRRRARRSSSPRPDTAQAPG
jgi:O-antigen/teichoic acid export membrane protein